MATTPSDPTSNNNESLGGQGLGDFFGDKKATQASGTRGLGDFFQDPVAQPTYQPSKPIETTQIDNIANSEGLTPTQRQVMGALLAQESGGNASVGNSVDGARGIGQIMPATFKMYAKAGEDIANPDHNLAVMARIVKDLGTKSGDDPAKIATGYFSGAGNINNNGTQAWKNDAADGNGKRVSSYVTDVINRMNSGGVVSVQQNQNQPKPLAADSAPTWKSIISKPEYMSMSAQEKAGMRDYYFNKYIAPDLQGDQVAQAKSWFDGEAAKIEPKELTLLDRAKATVQKLYSGGTTQPDNPDAVYDPVTGVDLSGSSVAAPKDESLGVMANYKGTGTPEKFDATKVGFAQASKNKIAYDRETERLKQLAASTGGVGLTSSEGKKLTPLDEEAFYKYNNDPLYSNTVVRSAVKGWEGLKQGAYGVNQAVWDLVGADRYAKDQGAKGDQSRAKILSMGEPENYGMRMLEGAVTSIAQQLPSMIGGIATGSEGMVLGSMFVNSFGQEYGQGKMSGLDSRDAAMRAGLFGSFEVLGEKAGLKFNMDKIRQATKGMSPDLLKGWLANTLTKELPGEFLTTTGQFMTDKASFGLNKEAGLADYLQQMADTGVQTILQSGLMAGGTNAIAKGVDKFNGVPTDVSLTNEGKTSDQAVQDAEPAPIAEAAPITTPVAEAVPTATPVVRKDLTTDDQDTIDLAESRREILMAKRDGITSDQPSEDGTKMVSIDRAGKGLSKAEQAELQAIEQAGGDVTKLNELYGITKETPANVPEPAKVEQEAQTAQGQEVAPKEDDYSTRYKDRVDRIKNASSSEEVDSILQSEYADGERHMEGTGLVERTAKSAKYSLDAKKKSIGQQQKYDSGEWVQIPDGGPGKTAAENIANKLGSEDANSEYRVSYNNDNYYVEKRKKPVAAAEPATVEQPQAAEEEATDNTEQVAIAAADYGEFAFSTGASRDSTEGLENQFEIDNYKKGWDRAAEKAKQSKPKTEKEAIARREEKKKQQESGGLSIGKLPNSAEQITVKDGTIYVGKYPAQDFDTGEDVRVANDATPQQIKDALTKAGAIGRGNKIFGLNNTETVKNEPQAIETKQAEAQGQEQQEAVAEPVKARKKIEKITTPSVLLNGADVMEVSDVAENGDDLQSPWLMADGRIARTGGDHISVIGDSDNYSDHMLKTGDIRAAFFNDPVEGYAIMLHVAEGQKPTLQQLATIEKISEYHNGKVTIKLGEKNGLVNPEYRGVTLSELREITAKSKAEEQAATGVPEATAGSAQPGGVTPNNKAKSSAETLPKELIGAKPRYGYGARNYELQFDSDADKAAYITAQTERSKRNDDYLKFAMKSLDMTEAQVIAHGQLIKENFKKQAKAELDTSSNGVLKFSSDNATPSVLAAPVKEDKPKTEKERNQQADYSEKWFGSQDKAQAFIDKKRIGDSHEVVKNGQKFEIKAKATAPVEAEKPKTEKEAKAKKTATPRKMTNEGRAVDGKPINGGDTFATSSGRATTPYPTQKSEKYASQWLIDNAIAEATARGDDFNANMFKGEKANNLPPASVDSMQEYLFGQQPNVVPSILKPLESNAAPADDLDTMFDDVLAEEVAKTKPEAKTEKEAKAARSNIVDDENPNENIEAQDGEHGWREAGSLGADDGSSISVSIRDIREPNEVVRQVRLLHNNSGTVPSLWQWNSSRLPDLLDLKINTAMYQYTISTGQDDAFSGIDLTDGDVVWSVYGDQIMQMLGKIAPSQNKQIENSSSKPKTEKQAKEQRTTKAAAVSAAKNTAQGFGNAIDGLGKLFGGKGTFGSGPVFNEETYAKAKPLFQAAVANFDQAGADIKEVMRAVVKSVLDKFGETVVNNMKPYIVRFVGEYNQQATKEQANDSTTTTGASEVNSDLAQGEQPAGSKTPARGTKQPRAGDGRANDRGVRKPRGRTQAANDGQQELGYSGRTDAVSDGQNDAVAGSGKRVSADFIPASGDLTRTGSWFDTAKRNIDLIELAIKIESEKRNATPEEQAQLAKYVGFGAGAIRNTLFPVPSEYAKRAEPSRLIWPNLIREERWQALAKRMEALPLDWQKSVLQSSQYAHYTSEGIIRSTWSAMQRLGFTGGKVFEPGMGIGSFSMLMPENVRNTSKYTGIEFDGPTALIAKLLQPEQHMLHDDFIKRKLPKDFFDVAIGNPPFSQTQIYGDPDYEKYGFMLHDFFFAKAIDRVRPGGLLAFVTSKGTMDKQNDKARKYLSERADLLGAIRLPSTAFEDNAGTSVVTDVIFLRKRAEGEAPAGKAWNTVATVETKDGPVVINEYFAANPEMVLGQNRISGNVDDEGRRINSNGMVGEKYTVVSYDKTPADLDAKFAAAVERLPENVYSVMSKNADEIKAETAKVDFDPAVKREGVVYIGSDGTLMRVESGVGKPLADGMKMTEADVKWFKGYVGLREMVQTARQAQVTDGNWEAELKKLNKAYDAFRKEHGPINDFRVQVRKSTDEDGNVVETESRIFKNRRRFREDYDAAILTQLETINEAGEIVKSPFLTGRTIGKPVTREVKSIGDALAVSLDSVGRLNIDDVAARIGLSKDEAIEALGNQIYKAPKGDWQLSDEYLSGDVVAKLEEAELAARIDPSLKRNVEALKEVQPEKLGPSQISAKLGASWVPESHVNAFAKEIDAGAVKFDPQTESWQVDGGNARNERKAGAEYGTAARSPSELLEAALNSRSVKITSKTAEGKTVTDAEATTAANEMLKKIKDKFKGWVWTDTERAAELMESYNKRFNNIAAHRFDGSHLTLPGVSLRFKLHPHQLRAIWRIIQTGNTYLAHAVGAGKTIEMIAAGMEQKRLGLIKKPLYVVPNHMLEQFSNEFMELYPLANIMVADDENFSADRRKAFIANATLNNPDAVIITHDAYQRIGIKEESVAPIRDEILADLEIELSSMAKDSGARVRRSQLEQQIEAVTQRFDRIIAAGGKDSTIKFEDIGVDFVFVDEAHAFRKLDFHTAQQIKGIDPNGSKRALDMYVKTRWLEKQKPGRSMVFASGTPVTNTMGELYTIMRFFAQNELDRGGISTFDAWARQFGEVMPALEPNAAGKYELVERFAKFDNVPELMSRVRQFMDVLTSENLGALVKRPDLIGGKPNLNIVMPSEDLKGYMTGHLANRIEASKKWKPSKDQPANPDPIVAIITDGRFAAIDPRFFGGTLGEDGSIITEMAKKVAAEYHATKNNVYIDKAGKPEAIKGSTQIVFYNLGFGEQSQKSRGFNSRAAFTKALTDGGVKRDEIAWFDDANTDAKKEAIFKDMRSGKIRILIGSAKKMGTGVNVQKRLSRLHYQDPPWFPADVEQPHGRIIRQGNQNSEVGIEWYTTKGTYQSTMWQMVARKQRFIDQAFTGDKNMRSMDDLGEASLFEQAAAVASGDPRAIQLAGLKQDVERLERLQAAHANEQIKVRSAIRDAEWEMKTANSRIATYGKAFKAIGEKYFSFTTGKVGSQTFEKQGEFGQAIKEAFNKNAANAVFGKTKEITLGKLSDAVTVTMDEDYAFEKPTGKFTLYVNVDGMPIEVATDASFGEAVDATGLARRMVNHVNSVEFDLKRAQQAKTTAETDLNKLNKKYGAPFEYQQDLLEKYAELKNLEAELKAEGEAKPEAAPVAIDENGNTGVQLLDITQDSILAGNGTAVTKLKSLAVRLSDGKITPAEYKLGLSQLTANIASTTLNSTGPANIKAALQAAKQSKIMRADTIDFALWLLDKNPQLANALSMSLQDSKKGSPAGSYKSAERLITLFKQSVNIGTAVHEILHHTERMMPPAIQREIVREWQRAWNSEWDKSSAEVRKAMSAMLQSASGDKQAFKDMLDAYNTGKLNYDKHYQLSNPSEYWAVNATRLMSDKYTANNSWAKQAKQFIKDVIAYFKKTFGLTEKDPIIKALNAVMNGDGTFKSDRVLAEMMAGVSVMNDLQDLPSQSETTTRTQQDLIKEFGKPTFSSIDWWDKSVGTQFNKAEKNPHFKKVFDLFLSRENATSLTAIRAAELAPGFLPRVDDFKSAAITVLKGKKASRQHDLAAQAVLEGTLAGASVLDGKVWSVEELTAKGLDDQGIALYQQARQAIDASLNEVAAAEGYAALQMFIPRAMRAAVMDNPSDAVEMLRKAIDKRIAMDEKRLQAMKNKGATDEAIAELEQDIADAKDALNTMEQIFAHVDLLKEAGYAPLMRFGKYFVSVEEVDPITGNTVVNDKGEPNTLFFSRYETEGEAQEAYFRMKVAQGDDATMKVIPGPVNDEKYKMYAGISPETMALFAEVVGAKEVENKFYQQAISERSALKRRLERKAIAGYSQDLPRVLANFITSNGRHAAGRYYTRDINSAIKYIPREKGDVQKEAQRLKEYLDNPQDAGAMSSGLAFTWFLGGNIASAAINATQPVMMSFPYLSQWGTGKAAAALTKAVPTAMGKKQITDAQLRHDLKRASQEGKVDAQEIFHLYTVGIQGVAGALSGKMSKLPLVGKHVKGATESGRARMNAALTLWGMPFAVVEGFNRRLTFIAAWNMAKEQGESDPYSFATRAVDETQGIYNKVNRPNWARSAVGRTVFTFTQFRVMNVELLKRMAKGGPAGRRAAAVYLAVLILAAGTAGLPYADDIDDIIDTVGQFFLGYDTNMKRNKREWAHKTLGKFYGDLALYGMSSQLPMDFGGRMGLGNMIPATGIAKPSNKDRTASELMELGGPVFGGLGKQAGDAYEEAAIGNYGKAAAALAPSSIKNLTAGLDMMATGKAKDMRGREKIDVTPAEGAIKAIGFNPTNVANVSRKNMPIQQDIALQKIVESNIVDKWAQGIAQKDDAMVKDAMNDMETWNRKNPDTPVAISGRQIQSKAKTLMTPADTRLIKGSPREMRGRVSAGLSED